MKHLWLMSACGAALASVTLMGCATIERLWDRDMPVKVEDVPAAVVSAARQAVPNLEIVEVETEKSKGGVVYELKGTAGSSTYELEISEGGEVTVITERRKAAGGT